MEEILHHLLSMEPYEKRDILHMNWCRISSITLEFDIFFRFLCWETTKLFDWKKKIFTNNKEHPNQQPKRRHGLTIVCFSWRSSGVCVVARSRQSLMQGNCLLSYLCVRCCALEICKEQHMTFLLSPSSLRLWFNKNCSNSCWKPWTAK